MQYKPKAFCDFTYPSAPCIMYATLIEASEEEMPEFERKVKSASRGWVEGLVHGIRRREYAEVIPCVEMRIGQFLS
jgi:hypothetical protein